MQRRERHSRPRTFSSFRPTRLCGIAAAALAALASVAASPADTPVQSDPVFTATRTDGSTFQGRLRRIDAAGEFTLMTPEGEEKSVALDALFKLSRDGAGPSLK